MEEGEKIWGEVIVAYKYISKSYFFLKKKESNTGITKDSTKIIRLKGIGKKVNLLWEHICN